MKNKYILIIIASVYIAASFIQLTFDFTLWSMAARWFSVFATITALAVFYLLNDLK